MTTFRLADAGCAAPHPVSKPDSVSALPAMVPMTDRRLSSARGWYLLPPNVIPPYLGVSYWFTRHDRCFLRRVSTSEHGSVPKGGRGKGSGGGRPHIAGAAGPIDHNERGAWGKGAGAHALPSGATTGLPVSAQWSKGPSWAPRSERIAPLSRGQTGQRKLCRLYGPFALPRMHACLAEMSIQV